MTTVDFRRSARINDIRRILGEREPDATETRIEALYKATGGETLHDNQWAMLLTLIQAEPAKTKLNATKALTLAAKAKALVKVQRVEPRHAWPSPGPRSASDEEYAEIRMGIVRSVMRDKLQPREVAEMLEALAEKYPARREVLLKEIAELYEGGSWLEVVNAQEARTRPSGG